MSDAVSLTLINFTVFIDILVAATPQSKNKNMSRANSLHHGVLLKDGYFADEVDSGQLVDRTIMKKGWEPAALYVFGDKTLLRVCVYIDRV